MIETITKREWQLHRPIHEAKVGDIVDSASQGKWGRVLEIIPQVNGQILLILARDQQVIGNKDTRIDIFKEPTA